MATARLTWAVSLLSVAVGVAAWAQWPVAALAADAVADRVVIRKSARVLELHRGDAVLRTYPVSLGSHPQGAKRVQGDGRTPEGDYVIDYTNAGSGFHRALHVSYPTAAQRADARARGVDPGGLVMIHGIRNGLGWLGRLHRLIDWTDGCVAVTDAEIEQIWRAVPVGTPVRIEP